MDKLSVKSSKLQLEGLWWLASLLLVLIILLPIWATVWTYPFYLVNTLFVLVFVHYARTVFFLRHTLIAKSRTWKLIIIFTTIPLVMILQNGIAEFQFFLDEEGIGSILQHLSIKKQNAMATYIKTEMIFFGVASITSAVYLCLRCILSIWRVMNTNKI
jgi:hypothetical protein